jgi:GT2 family glycosyltransferase
MIPVLIVAYRNWPALQRCIDSVQTSTVEAEPWVHDNSLINIGLTKGVNKLLQVAEMRGDKYAIWANQDVIFLPDAIEKMISFMDAHPLCAIAGVKQLATDQPDRIIHGGCTDAYPAGVHLVGSVLANDCAESKPMAWVNMAAAILRMEALEEIGLLDDRFFLVGQDSDLCYRAWLGGWQCWYCAEAVVMHDRGGVSSNPSPEQLAIVTKDMEAWGEKWSKKPEPIHDRT